MARRSEQGNILGFVLVGALLLGLLIGGMYIVKSYNPSSDGIALTTNDDNNKSNSTQSKDTTSSKAKDDADKKANDDKLKAALDAQSNKKEPAAPKATEDSSGSTGKSESSHETSSATTDVNKLPATGPGEIVASLAGATLLVGSTVSYARSRRLI